MASRRPTDADRSIGDEMRRRRRMARKSQQNVADYLGVSVQQYGKYERGENRISVARHQLALRFLDESVKSHDVIALEMSRPKRRPGFEEAAEQTPFVYPGHSIAELLAAMERIAQDVDLCRSMLSRLQLSDRGGASIVRVP